MLFIEYKILYVVYIIVYCSKRIVHLKVYFLGNEGSIFSVINVLSNIIFASTFLSDGVCSFRNLQFKKMGILYHEITCITLLLKKKGCLGLGI